jgi:hypothetical protein
MSAIVTNESQALVSAITALARSHEAVANKQAFVRHAEKILLDALYGKESVRGLRLEWWIEVVGEKIINLLGIQMHTLSAFIESTPVAVRVSPF